MARFSLCMAAAFVALIIVVVFSAEPALAQGGPGPGGGGGRPGGGRGGGRGGERMRKMMEEIQKEADQAAYDAAKRATAAGKSQEQAKEAARKAADEIIDKKVDEAVERMGQGHGGGGQGGGGQGMPNPDEMKKRIKERAAGDIDKVVGEATSRAIEDYKAHSWKEIVPKDELVDEDREEREIAEEIKETTLFDDFKDTADKPIDKLKLTKPVIVFVYITDDGKKATEKKIEKCAQMQENVFGDEEFVSSAQEFIRLKVNLNSLSKPLKKKYRVHTAPVVVFFDCTGKRLFSFTNVKQKVKTLLKKMESYVEKSEKAREKALEEAEKKDDEGGES